MLTKDKKNKSRLILATACLQLGLTHAAISQTTHTAHNTQPHALSHPALTSPSTHTKSTRWHQFRLKPSHFAFELGGFFAYQGTNQNIGIQGLTGDQYTITDHETNNGLVGMGYFFKGLEKPRYNLDYGLEAFFGRSSASGTIIQEHVFTNLAYTYNINNFPLYAAAKALFKTKQDRYGIVVNAGIGPNFMKVYAPIETSLGSNTVPDNAFVGGTSTAFSAMAGLGFRINHVFGSAPLECGYRFFYLGQGQLKPRTDQILNNLETGQDYAHAVTCGILI